MEEQYYFWAQDHISGPISYLEAVALSEKARMVGMPYTVLSDVSSIFAHETMRSIN